MPRRPKPAAAKPPSRPLPAGTKQGLLSAYANPTLQQRSRRSAEKVLVAAEMVLGRDGWTGFTINSVAAEAGTSVGGIYRRYENKEQLLRALKDRVLERADADHRDIGATCKAKSLDAAVAHYVTRRIASLRRYSHLLRQIFEGQQHDLVMEERGRQSINVGMRVFRSVVGPHRAEISHPDPELAIETAFFMMTAIFMRRTRGPISDLSLDHLNWDVLEHEVKDAITLYLGAKRPTRGRHPR